MEDALFERAGSVNSRSDFVDLVQHLAADCRENGELWENRDIGCFLDALAGFCRDMDRYYDHKNEAIGLDAISWRMAAQMMLAATVYE